MRRRPTKCSSTWHRCQIPLFRRMSTPAPLNQMQHRSITTGTRQALAQIALRTDHLQRLLGGPLPQPLLMRLPAPAPLRQVQHLNKSTMTRQALVRIARCSNHLVGLLYGAVEPLPKLRDRAHKKRQQLPPAQTMTCGQRLVFPWKLNARQPTVTSRAWILTQTQT